MRYAVILLILVVLVATSGCMKKATVQNIMTDTLAITPIECEEDAGCPRGYGCFKELCYKKCSQDTDCPGSTPDCVSPIELDNLSIRYCI